MKNSGVAVVAVLSWLLSLAGCCSSTSDEYTAAMEAYETGEYEKAVELFTLAAETSDNPAIYANRANCHSYLGNLDAALDDYQIAIDKAAAAAGDPNHPSLATLYYNRGFAYERAQKYKEAIRDYEKTIALDDAYPDVKNNLAWILATCPRENLRDPSRAVTIAQAQCQQTDWNDASVLDTLAAAHAAAGDFPQAIERQQQAIKLTSDAETRGDFQQRLELYRSNQPYVEAASGD